MNNNKCEKCIHYSVCEFKRSIDDTLCDHFKDKSLFVELPCKVGDKVYIEEKSWGAWMLTSYAHRYIDSKIFLFGEVVSIIKTRKQLLIKIRISGSNRYIYRHKRYPVSAIGKTVFLTKEDTQKKDQETPNDHNSLN